MPDQDTLASATLLAHQMDRFTRRMEAGIHQRAEPVDVDRVGPLGGMALLALHEIEPAPIQSLVAMMRRDKSQMTRLIQMLERKGYVERHACATDGRVSLMRLSDKGRDFVGAMQAIMADVIGDLLKPLDPQEREQLTQMLQKI
ncbi:MAG: MarR family winged helix-turn-helix transcriptional regulator [Cohaesibacteraceae bacterium]